MVSRLLPEVVDKKKTVKPNHWGLCKGYTAVAASQVIKQGSASLASRLKIAKCDAKVLGARGGPFRHSGTFPKKRKSKIKTHIPHIHSQACRTL
jgi:hypothetical protein